MPPAAFSAFGTLLKLGDGGGTEVFTTIAEVRSINGPNLTAEVIDVTSHSSPGATREKIASLLDSGEISFTISFLPTNATHSASAGLLLDYRNRTRRNFQLVFPDGSSTTWTINAIVTSFGISAPIDDALTADITLTLTGIPTFS